jgi:hypothetical protein
MDDRAVHVADQSGQQRINVSCVVFLEMLMISFLLFAIWSTPTQ